MTRTDFLTLLPFLILIGASVVIMLLIAIKRYHRIIQTFTLLSLAAAFISLFRITHFLPRQISTLIIVDNFAVFFLGLFFAAAFVVVLISFKYLENHRINHEEYYLLLILATLGSSVLVVSQHFISFFLGLEILSVSLYSMIGYLRMKQENIEAGIKYLILAAASSAFLLFGMALLYAETGTMSFPRLAVRLAGSEMNTIILLGGFALLIVGIGFKLALAPFHAWTPDVYEGAPAPVTAFIATVSKGGMFALLLRIFAEMNAYQYQSLVLIFSIIAIASMFVGNLLALLQKNVKRILAYSSIAHLGYLLVAFLASGELGPQAAAFYLVAYFITILGSFGIIALMSNEQRDADSLEDYRGLFWRRPWLAAVFAAMMFSLAGIPLTAGFLGKFYVVLAGVGSTLWTLVVILVVNSAIGLYYYLRIVVAMYYQPEGEKAERAPLLPPLSLSGGIALAGLTILLIWFGVFPAGIMDVIKNMVSNVSATAIQMHLGAF